jgi:acetolactate synthase-1/2/3 large subunit
MSADSTRSGARHLAESLAGYGVTHVFYVDAILRRAMVDLEALGIRRILVHGEKAAAYMADGYARVARRPGVCLAQSVGAANLAAGLQDAHLACTPVVALTGKKPPMFQHRNAYQEIPHTPLFSAVTKYDADVVVPEQLPHLLRQAFRSATTGKPGPVHLDLIGREARELEVAEGLPVPVAEPEYATCPPFRPAADAPSIARASQAIRDAERPVLVAGGGVRLSDAAAALVALAEHRGIPVATSVNGKGSIDERHPLSVGVVGSYSAWCANRVVHEADLVIYVGSATGDQTTHNWTVPAVGARVLQIDLDPAELGRSYPGTIGVTGDARTVLEQLHAALPASDGHAEWLAHVAAHVAAFAAEYAERRGSSEVPIRPERLCAELGAVLPDNAILVSDTGYSAIWAATMIPLTSPRQTFIRAAGSLGWGFPAALGAKCAAPDRPVVCFTGDGGFWYHLQELETACRYGIHTVTVVNNNNGFSQGITDVHRQYGERPGNPRELYEFTAVNFAQVARDFGAVGLRVEDPAQLGDVLRHALMLDAPVVVEVMTHFSARAPDPWTPPH